MKTARKLIPALALLLVAAVLASTASYAWFTMSRSVTATDMGFTATAPDNLLICATYNGTFAKTAQIDTLPSGVYLYPVSSIDGTSFYTVDERENDGSATDGTTVSQLTGATLKGVVIDGTSITDEAGADISGALAATGYAYLDYKFYVKTTGTSDVSAKIDEALTAITATPDSGTDDKAKNAVRIAVISAFTVDNTGATTDTTAMIAGAKMNVYAEETTPAYFANANGPIIDADPAAYSQADNTLADSNLTDNATAIVKFPATTSTGDVVVEVTVRIWLEGQSSSCVNEIAADAVKVNLGFSNTAA